MDDPSLPLQRRNQLGLDLLECLADASGRVRQHPDALDHVAAGVVPVVRELPYPVSQARVTHGIRGSVAVRIRVLELGGDDTQCTAGFPQLPGVQLQVTTHRAPSNARVRRSRYDTVPVRAC